MKTVLFLILTICLFIGAEQCEQGDPCAPQDVKGEGGCAQILGVFWNGAECAFISGCSCVGADCDKGFETPEECQRAYRGC